MSNYDIIRTVKCYWLSHGALDRSDLTSLKIIGNYRVANFNIVEYSGSLSDVDMGAINNPILEELNPGDILLFDLGGNNYPIFNNYIMYVIKDREDITLDEVHSRLDGGYLNGVGFESAFSPNETITIFPFALLSNPGMTVLGGVWRYLSTTTESVNGSITTYSISSMVDAVAANEISDIIIDPNESYIYRTAKPEHLRERIWFRCKLKYDDGYISENYLPASEITITADSETVTNIAWVDSPNDFGELDAGSLQIEFDRAEEQPSFHLIVTLNSDPNISTEHLVYSIGTQSSFQGQYTPGIGGGVQSGPSGGGGNFGVVNGTPEASDPIAPSLPTNGSFEGSVANSGLFVHYAMNGNMLEVVGDWLWATDLGLIIAKEVLSILYGSPIESAISLMSYPFNVTALPGVVTNSQQMYWGSHAIGEKFGGVNALAITNPYATIDWGTVQLTEFWGNFLDYAPHTKLELYLPWCTGFVPIDPNECLPGSLRVVTNIELAKGTCLHNVIGNDGRVIATHAGVCGKQLPLTALDTSGKALQLVSTAASAIVAGGSGMAADAAGSRAADVYRRENLGDLLSGDMSLRSYRAGMSAASKSASAPHRYAGRRAENRALAGSAAASRIPVSVQRSGSFSGSSAGLGVQYPYLILSRPTQSVPSQYGHHYGYPSNIYTPLTNLRGYTEVGEIHLNGFVCTEDELEEIDSLLKGGVIL